jgi:hypothetical protein
MVSNKTMVLSNTITITVTARISVTLTSLSNNPKLGSDVKLKVVVTNMTDHQMWLGRAPKNEQGEFLNRIEVRGENMDMPDKTRYYQMLAGIPLGEVAETSMWAEAGFVAKPGESVSEGVSLSKLFKFTQPGKYMIQAVRQDSETKTLVKSNIVSVTVKP